MEEYTQITLDEWMQWREDIRKKLAETAGNFVHIGYRLKQIRDSGMYDGAADIFGFAEKEYGLSASTVSRFIAINEKYSEGGNSLELKEEYKGFSSSKLAEMLTLPDSEIQLITEKTTIREIRELKSFNREEKAEYEESGNAGEADKDWVGQAVGEPRQGSADTPLGMCLIDFFRDKKETLNRVLECLRLEEPDYKEMAELMAPTGQTSHRKGIVFLFFYDWIMGVKYKLMTEPEPVSMTWQDFLEIVRDIFSGCADEDVWTDFYGDDEASSVATSQQEEGEPEADGGKQQASDQTGEEDGETAADPETTSTEGLSDESVEDAAAGQDDAETEQTVTDRAPDEDRHEKRSIAEQKKEQKTDTDTEEEEKKQAETLHTLKMLEGYYIYLFDDEREILKRMLEDCKRRKREYGFDDVGSTL